MHDDISNDQIKNRIVLFPHYYFHTNKCYFHTIVTKIIFIGVKISFP